VVLTALIAGTALSSLVVGALADRVGRRRSYAVFSLGVAAGAMLPVLLVVALTGTLATDVVDNSPATGSAAARLTVAVTPA
jgi:MFS family permease